jgi:segregation and condensation protein B
MAEGSASTKKRRRGRAKTEADPTPGEASVGDLVAALDEDVDADAEADATAEEAAATASPEDDGAEEEGASVAPGDAPDAEAEGREVPDGVQLTETLPMAPEDDLSQVVGEASARLVTIVESLLFAADKPLTVKDIRRLLKDPSVRQIQLAVKELIFETAERGVVVGQVAGGFRLRTNPKNAKYVQRMLAGRPARLSRSQLEALAVIAYRQPITKAEIDHVRGVDCSAVLRLLLERDLARIVGRKEEAGRPILYGTTVEFLEFFNLRSLRDMPDLHEFRELTDDSRATLRERYGEEAEEIESEVLGQQTLGLQTEGDGADDADDAADDELVADDDDEPVADDDEAEPVADDDEAEPVVDAEPETGDDAADDGEPVDDSKDSDD